MDVHLDIALLAMRLQRAMDTRQMTQRDLSRRSGVNCPQVWKILHQRRPQVQAETLMRLAGALGISLDWLVGLSDEMLPGTRGIAEPSRRGQAAPAAGRGAGPT